MTTSFFSCGNSSKENSKKDEPKTVDFFDTIEMNVIGTYPFLVVGIDDDTFVNDESLPDMGFAFELKVTELNTDSAEIQLDIIPESFENYLNKKNMILSDKKDMTFNLAACDYDSILLSEKDIQCTCGKSGCNRRTLSCRRSCLRKAVLFDYRMRQHRTGKDCRKHVKRQFLENKHLSRCRRNRIRFGTEKCICHRCRNLLRIKIR